MLEQIHQTPENFGWSRSRWTLELLKQAADSLQALSRSGICRRLRKWKIRRKRGRLHLISPDTEYLSKIEAVTRAKQEAAAHPDQVVLLYGDETTIYRRPSTGLCYQQQARGGHHQPTTPSWPGSNTKHRLGAVLDAIAGRVLSVAGYCVGVEALCRLLRLVRATYGETIRIILAWDNWPVHYNPRVLEVAEALKIEILWLPTYAPWTNPIEKLWLKLKQEVIVMHRHSSQFSELKLRIKDFLLQYNRPAPDLLKFVGLKLPI